MGAKRTFSDLSFEEKLTLITDYLGSIKPTDRVETLNERMEWLRRHIPAHDTEDDTNYVFISYSHRDYDKVYSDLAFFSYNTKKRVRFWYDEGLPAGDDWFSEAEKRLSDPNCSGVVFYLSENLLRSSAVLREIELVKKLNKPYFTITLDNHKFCAADYLDATKDADILAKVESVFPRDDTSVSFGTRSSEIFDEASRVEVYDDEFENAFYRIFKIEQAFSVVEELLPDFVFEEVEGGLSLVEYRGDETDVYIPSRVGKNKVVEIKAAFNNVVNLYIPETVERILPVEITEAKVEYDAEDEQTMSYAAIYDMILGGLPLPSTPFGYASSLVSVNIDKDNPVFYSVEGIIYNKNKTLVRFPSRLVWEDRFLDGIEVIGNGAFLGYESPGAQIVLPNSVTRIEDSAFAFATLFFVTMEDSVNTIERLAFANCKFSEVEGIRFPLMTSGNLESVGEFCFMNMKSDFLLLSGNIKELPKGACYGFDGDTVSMESLKELQLIHMGAFACCRNVESVSLPKSLVAIDNHAFTCTDKLFSITLPKKTSIICPQTFDNMNILKYIIYEGNSKDLFYLRLNSEIEDADYLDLIINKDQWIKRLRAKSEVKRRQKIKAKYEKMYQGDPSKLDNPRKRHLANRITAPTVLFFIISMLTLLVVDYRRLVMGVSPDLWYWVLSLSGLGVSFMSAKHLYWSSVVKKTKKAMKKNGGKLEGGFFDAWTSMAAIGFIVFAIASFLSTILISGAFNLTVIRGLFGGA